MSKTQRTPAFKKKVVLEALREDKTLTQLASEHGVHSVQITQWKREMLDGMESSFVKKGKTRLPWWSDQAVLQKKIGQMTIEMDYLKKN